MNSETPSISQGNFNNWMEQHPDFSETRIIKENETWGRIICKWTEKKDGKELNHVFSAAVHLPTGDLYLDCRKRKIFTKNVALLVARPLHTTVKTLYHASLAGVVWQVYKAATGKQTKKEALKKSFKSLADIVRTPIYGTAMTITAIASVAIAPFAPNKLYDLRRLQGRIEQDLNWGVKFRGKPLWNTLAICFQSSFNAFNMGDRGFDPTIELKEVIKDYESRTIPLNERQKQKLQIAKDELQKWDSEKIQTLKNQIAEQEQSLENAGRAQVKNIKSKLMESKKQLNEVLASRDKYVLPELRKDSYETTVYSTSYDEKINDLQTEIQKQVDKLERSKSKDPKKIKKKLETLNNLENELEKLREVRRLDSRLTNFARSMIVDRRSVWNPFYQIKGSLSPDVEYKSANLSRIGEKSEDRLLFKSRILLEKAKSHLKDHKFINKSQIKDLEAVEENLTEVLKELDNPDKKVAHPREEKLIKEAKPLLEAVSKKVTKKKKAKAETT